MSKLASANRAGYDNYYPELNPLLIYQAILVEISLD